MTVILDLRGESKATLGYTQIKIQVRVGLETISESVTNWDMVAHIYYLDTQEAEVK